MENKVDKRRKSISLQQCLEHLQRQAIAEWLEWTDEVNDDFSSEIEFLLGLKGRWLLCHMGKTAPHTIRLRLIGERDYVRVKPKDFIDTAKQKLLH